MHNSGRNSPLRNMLENGCLHQVGKLGTERLPHKLCYFHQLPLLTPTQTFTQCVQEIRQFIRKTLYLKPGHQHFFLSSFHHYIRSGSQSANLVNMRLFQITKGYGTRSWPDTTDIHFRRQVQNHCY